MKLHKSSKLYISSNCIKGVSCSSLSDIGCVRESNEDRMILKSWKDGSALLAVVADGMGGNASGEVAAQIAVDTFVRLLGNPLPKDHKERYDILMNCFGDADAMVRDRSSQDMHLYGMGTTTVAAIFTPHECLYLYAGDSRLYHIRNGCILHVTADHSVIRMLLETGRLKPEDVSTHPMRSVITSCLGGGDHTRLSVEPNWVDEVSESHPSILSIQSGDTIILCSDGLTNEVSDERLIEISLKIKDAEEFCKALVKEAKDAGGHDNITVIAVILADPEVNDLERKQVKSRAKLMNAKTKLKSSNELYTSFPIEEGKK